MASQSVAEFDKTLTTFALLRESLVKAKITTVDAQKRRISDALCLVWLDHVAARSELEDLSLFEQRLVAIAHAIVTRPRLVVVQDPDVYVQACILDVLLKLQDELRLTMVISSTEIVMLGSLCDRLVVLQSGEIVGEGSAQKLLEAPQHERTKLLLQKAPNKERAA